eukprot:15336724-Ditylum_brightwellii.AAC.1
MHVDGNKDDSVEDSVDGGDKHLIHFTKAVDCCLKKRSKQNKCVDDNKDDSIEDSVDGGEKQKNVCVDDDKEEGVDNSDDNSDHGGDKHLTHLTQVENNVNLGGCDKHLSH